MRKHEQKRCPRCHTLFECKSGSILLCRCHMFWFSLLFLALLVPDTSLLAADKKSDQINKHSLQIVLDIGKKQFPTLAWDAKTLVSADINCDKINDYAILGYDKNNAYLMVVYGPLSLTSKQETVAMGLSGQASTYLCGSKADLSVENLIKPSEEEVGVLEGYKESKVCKGLNVSDGMCDSFHFYWDHKNKELSSWRL